MKLIISNQIKIRIKRIKIEALSKIVVNTIRYESAIN
jgi:hypothetical protein